MINKEKLKIVILNKSKIFDNLKNIIMNNSSFEIVRIYNYLDHIINYNLLDSVDIIQKLTKFYIAFNIQKIQ